jgi:hypothetical protein
VSLLLFCHPTACDKVACRNFQKERFLTYHSRT